jgi:TonB family protein
MKVMIRGNSNSLRRTPPFAVSLFIHGTALGWVIIAASLGVQESPRPIYDQVIKPNETKIIWYHLQTRVPDVRPVEANPTPKPPRAVHKLDQNLITGKRELPARQKIWMQDPPKAELKPKIEPLPNLLAVATMPKVERRKFVPPPPPVVKPKTVAKIEDAPDAVLKQTAITPADLPISPVLPRAVRRFVPPTVARNTPPPPAPSDTAAPPDTTAVAAPAPTMAIIGLDPAKTMEIAKPPAPRDAEFAAGPKPNPEGESAPPTKAMLSVPSIYANGGPKDIRPLTAATLAPRSPTNLLAAMPMAGGTPRAPAPGTQAPHVANSPDPRMNGRMIYTMAIQMPNVTSYSGSWMVWFAEHEPLPGGPPLEMRPPEPMRKVDPRYVRDAANERVEGTVRLTAVIRKDGHIDSVELLKHLDDRLDRTAAEALAKWIFEPAHRDGTPVDVDAVFEIPFRLAPRVAQ